MRIMRTFSLAGALLAGGMLTGCWGDCWCCGGSSKSTPPVARQTLPASTPTAQANGWSNTPSSQDRTSTAATTTTNTQPSNFQPGNTVNQQLPIAATSTQATPASVDTNPAMPAVPTRTLSNLTPTSATTTTTTVVPPPVDPTPPPPAREIIINNSSPQAPQQPRVIEINNSTLNAPAPPALPPPPAQTGPAASTSKYTPQQQGSIPLPPETIPGQSKIPVLPQGPTPVE